MKVYSYLWEISRPAPAENLHRYACPLAARGQITASGGRAKLLLSPSTVFLPWLARLKSPNKSKSRQSSLPSLSSSTVRDPLTWSRSVGVRFSLAARKIQGAVGNSWKPPAHLSLKSAPDHLEQLGDWIIRTGSWPAALYVNGDFLICLFFNFNNLKLYLTMDMETGLRQIEHRSLYIKLQRNHQKENIKINKTNTRWLKVLRYNSRIH